jgi:hypothetical protein
MKTFSKVSGVAAALCAFAFFATPALAEEFEATRNPPCSTASPCATKGISPAGEFSQELHFGAFTIKCDAKTKAKTVGEGAITWEFSPTFATEIKFYKCDTVAKFGDGFVGGLHTTFNEGEPMKILYHINGYAEIGTGETTSEVEVGGGAATFKIAGKICKIDWPAQTVPAKAEKDPEEQYSSAVYSNREAAVAAGKAKKFPSGYQKKLVIANEFKKMNWEYEEGQCTGEGGFEEEAKKVEGHDATWTGTLEEEVVGGNLGVTSEPGTA